MNEKLGETDTASTKPVGRPSAKPLVYEAFTALTKAGAIDFSKAASQSYQPIREWLIRTYPENAGYLGGLSNETIRQTISAEFKKRQPHKRQ